VHAVDPKLLQSFSKRYKTSNFVNKFGDNPLNRKRRGYWFEQPNAGSRKKQQSKYSYLRFTWLMWVSVYIS